MKLAFLLCFLPLVTSEAFILIPDELKRNHSILLNMIGIEKTYDPTRSELVPSIFDNGNRIVDNIVIIGSKIPTSWDRDVLIDYICSGGNLAIFLESGDSLDYKMERIFLALGITIINQPLIDNYSKINKFLFTKSYSHPFELIIGEEADLPIGYSGRGMTLDDRKLEYLMNIVSPSPTTIFEGENSNIVDLSIIALFQSKDNARVSIFSPEKMLDDSFLNRKDLLNRKAVNKILKWTFFESLVLEMAGIFHSSKERTKSEHPKWQFFKGETMEVNLRIAERCNSNLIPFLVDDIKIELIMMEPYIRAIMEPIFIENLRYQSYSRVLRLPDRQGIFTLRLEYNRPGFSRLTYEEEIVIRPPIRSRNFHPIFIPYYLVIFLSLCLVFIVSLILYLNNNDWNGHSRLDKAGRRKATRKILPTAKRHI